MSLHRCRLSCTELTTSHLVVQHITIGPEENFTYHRAKSRLAHSQWETLLQSNTVSHWLGANLGSALLSYLHFPRAMEVLKWLDYPGGTPKKFWRGVRLRFSIGYPWLRKFRSKTYPWLRRISWSWAHFCMILRNFSPNIPFIREIFRKQMLIRPQNANFLGFS